MLALILSLVALVVGPVVHHLTHQRPGARAALEGFVLVAIIGLVLAHILPDVVRQGGWICVAPALIGLLGPEIFERLLHRTAHGVHQLAMVLALVGLLLHASLDGVALASGAMGRAPPGIAVAIVLHRIPVGLTIWWLLRPRGLRLPAATLGLVGIATLIGFLAGERWLAGVSGAGLALFQALVAGTLLHVVLHRPHHDEPSHAHTPGQAHEAHEAPARRILLPTLVGALLALALVAGLSLVH